MGACGSKTEGELNSKIIDSQLRADHDATEKEVKMLLLGTGESGKSTIVKQMKVMYQGGYSPEECQSFVAVIAQNTLASMKSLILAVNALGLALDSDEHRRYATEVVEAAVAGDAMLITAAMGTMLETLWKDNGIQTAYTRRAEFQLNDSAPYYLDSIARISASGFMPTKDDVLHSRVRTTGIVETQFSFGDMRFRMFDVGGQRNERKKWIHCFQDVTSVVFVVGISEYDQKLLEDSAQNRMTESLLLFDEICNSRWFLDTSLILFLNKIDLFRQKLANKIPLTNLFPDFDGQFDEKKASDYITKKFTEKNKKPTKGHLPSSHLRH